MATNKIALLVNNGNIDVLEEVDFDFRLNRFVQDARNFQSKGGDYSTTLTLPFTKNNSRILGVTSSTFAINKFNRNVDYTFKLQFNGVDLMSGTMLLKSISMAEIKVELYGENVDWFSKLEEKSLNRLGYVNNEPTWFGSNRLGKVFEGGITINEVNTFANRPNPYDLTPTYGYAKANRYTDYICPFIIRHNAISLMYPNAEGDILGLYDSGGVQVVAPKDFPNELPVNDFSGPIVTLPGKFEGYTFEDFPPCIYYRNLIEKCFEEIGYSVSCPLFNEDWFNALFVPYKGSDFYKYNYRTLAELSLEYLTSQSITFDASTTTDPLIQEINTYGSRYLQTYPARLGLGDDIYNRIDRIANFKKFKVTDEDAGYIVPASGKYKIKVISQISRSLDDYAGFLPALNFIGDGIGAAGDYAWDDNVFVVTRKDQNGNYVLSPNDNPIEDVVKFIDKAAGYEVLPSTDIVAFVSPKRCIAFSNNDERASGSPLSNNVQQVNVISRLHTVTNDTVLNKSCFSSVTFEIEIDLLKNERIGFYAIGVTNYGQTSPIINNSVSDVELIVNSSSSAITVEYLCGYEDISLADNLPDMSAKTFIKSFINTFNLSFIVDSNNKKVSFTTYKEFYNNDNPYDITNRVDVGSVKYLPTNPARNLTIGYENDDNSFQLTENTSGCIEDIAQSSDYANKKMYENFNIYSENTEEFTNGFTAVKNIFFYSNRTPSRGIGSALFDNLSNLETATFATGTYILGRVANLFNTFDEGFIFSVPDIRSIDAQKARVLGDVEYEFDQDLCLLKFYGTYTSPVYQDPAKTFLNFQPIILIDSPDNDYVNGTFPNPSYLEGHLRFAVSMTNCKFDKVEELDFRVGLSGPDYEYLVFTNNPYIDYNDTFSPLSSLKDAFIEAYNNDTTLRYDDYSAEIDFGWPTFDSETLITNGLYSRFFNDIVELQNKSYVLECQALLSCKDWNNLQPNRIVKYLDSLYRILEITDYDVTNSELCTIRLLRLI